jgi:nitrous oxidase accessory protein NosD
VTPEGRRLQRIAIFFAALVAVMAAHEVEHVVQLYQKDVAGAPCPNDCRGLLGFAFDLEWVHFAYNTTIFAALAAIYVVGRMWRSEWRARFGWVLLSSGLVVQGYHVLEHVEKLSQWFANGRHSPTPGILGQHLSLVELHFTFNTVVFLLVVGGFVGLGFHQLFWRSRTPARLATAVALTAVTLAGGAWIWSERPPTVRVGAGVHQGPIVIDRAQRLVGEPGAIVENGIVITANDVVVRDLEVRGGEYGIEVEEAENVLLQNVAISGATMDGVNARRSSLTIRRCSVRMAGEYTQGIDISFAFDRPPSRVSGCTVVGGQEGIVSHMAHVDFRGNVVRKTTLRGIAVTEMSMGTVTRNAVEDAMGVGIYCGDYSHCKITRNSVRGIHPDPSSDDRLSKGLGILSQFYAQARISENGVVDSPGGVRASSGATIEHD